MHPTDDAAAESVRDVVIAMIVAHALDDLEAEHVDLPTALTLTALAGWQEAERSAGRAFSFPLALPDLGCSEPPLPEPRSEP